MPKLIGIAGGTASGKTSLAQALVKEYSNSTVTIIREDDYYKDQTKLTMEERIKVNYDHPLAFDYDLLYAQLDELCAGRAIRKPIYDYTQHNRSTDTELVEPVDVIIVEGLFVLENKELRNKLDIKIFVDTPADVRFIRRLKRDITERGREMDNIINQYLTTVRVMHEEFVEPSKKYADIIVPEGATNTVALDMIATKISSIINKKMI